MNFPTKVCNKIYTIIFSFFTSLFIIKTSKSYFSEVYQETRNLYIEFKASYLYENYLIEEWKENVHNIESFFLEKFNFKFLNNGVIKKTMFVKSARKWRNIQKDFLEKNNIIKNLEGALIEYDTGSPTLSDFKYKTSGNTIHNLYHLLKFCKETNTPVERYQNIVEIGGGYGNLAKIFKNINKVCTYTIIDIPIFSYIQAVYLKTIFGKKSVNLILRKAIKIESGLINLYPLSKDTTADLASSLNNVDLLVSTWALSESNEAMQAMIKDMDYFKASYILFAYQKSNKDFAFAELVKDLNANYECLYSHDTEYIADNFYLFAKRL